MSNSIDGGGTGTGSDADGNNYARKKMVRCRSTSDIISNLPCNIVDKILICLPIQDATRTSVLSTKWRFKWLSISQLVFNCQINDFFCSISPKSQEKIWSLIHRILVVHRGPLQKFVIDVDEEVENTCSLLDHIILFLIGKDIREVSIFPPPMASSYTIPSTLFLCTHLTHLNLTDCNVRLPPKYFGFSKLISVELDTVRLTAKDCNTFLSKCPLLQRLKLQYCELANAIELDAPKLKFFYFDCPEISIFIKHVPVLSTLIIKRCARLPGKSSNTMEVFESLPAIEYLSVGESFVMDLIVGAIPERLPTMLNHLKSVKLPGLHLNSSKEVQFALLVIRSSPNLHQLKIKMKAHGNNVSVVPNKSLYLVEDSFDRLREVIMKNFNGTVRELEFIEILLAKSRVLKKVIIQPSKEISDKKVVAIVKALLQFQRASTRAQIIFLDSEKVVEDNGNA